MEKPTPIRASLGVDAPDTGTAERTFSHAGVEWRVRIAGRSSGGRTHSNANLLELHFEPVDGSTEAQKRWAIARLLGDLSDLQLSEILGGSA